MGYSLSAMEQEGTLLSFHDAYEAVFAAQQEEAAPKTFKEAMKRPDADQWLTAAQDEIQAHLDNGTWELVQLPPGRRAIGSRWVFKIKRQADGSIERYKGRVVAKGFSQRPGLDFEETFAPTTKWAALRTIFAIAALEDLELESVDISTAYLNGVMPPEHEVYMQQPEGFQERGPEWVCKLKKGLYGLKQGGRLWHEKLDSVLQEIGFGRVQSDRSVYVWQRSDGFKVIVPVFVDDLTLASKSKAAIAEVKAALKKAFKLRELGPTSFLLGVAVTRNRSKRTLQLSQRQYIIEMLERFNMADCSAVSTPMDPGVRLCAAMSPQTPQEKAAMKDIPYINAVGALMYLSVATRPDISHSVGVLCRYNSNPGPAHWKAVKHLFRYLQGTKDLKLTYAPSSSPELFTTFSDADHGGNPDTGKSTTGYALKMGSGVVSWSSKLQPLVALSTTEAEYVAATSSGAECIWMRSLLSELGYDMSGSSLMRLDNQSALAVAKNPEHHGRMKHMDLRYFWLRDVVEKGLIRLEYVHTDDMVADVLTKSLARVKVLEAQKQLGLFP